MYVLHTFFISFNVIYLYVVLWHTLALQLPLPTHANRIYLKHERERIKCVSLSTEGEARTSPYRLPGRPASPCCCLSLLNDPDIHTFSQECSDSRCVFVCARPCVPCVRVCVYDMIRSPCEIIPLLLRLVDFSPHLGVEFICRSKIVICKCGHSSWETINFKDWNI